MKKSLCIIIPLIFVSCLAAITFDYDGELRTRAAFYNDWAERDGGHVDTRGYLGMNSQLVEDLSLRINLQFGNQTWGIGGGGIPAAIPIHAYELYIDYRLNCIESNIRVGQQYWNDPMSLILDDSFSGVTLTKDNLFGFKTELGWVKQFENNTVADDDVDHFFVNMQTPNPLPMGIYASYSHYPAINFGSFTFMPYASLDVDPVQVDAAAFLGLHFNESPGTDEVGFGAVVKAKADMGPINVGADILFATENGITCISPYYQNGLYIYGLGKHHDGLSLYWNDPQWWNNDTGLSLVGNINAPLGNRLSAFAAAGMLLDEGAEVNGGLVCDVIPEVMSLAGYAAVGFHDSPKITNYAVGTTLMVTLP